MVTAICRRFKRSCSLIPLPNFFIIGAPKSGTTALYDALDQHPDIYMSPVKEPLFFACDGEPEVSPGPIGSFMKRNAIWRPSEYLSLFAGVEKQRAIGEASVVYLRWPLAAQRIRRNVPDAKIIAILRHPAERAHSHFWFSVQNGGEPSRSFAEALEQEKSGQRDGWFSELHHRENGFYFRQLSRYYELFPREKIKIYLYEEWENDPRALLRDLFRFLEVKTDFATTLQRTNVTFVPRNRRLQAWAQHPERLSERLRGMPSVLHAPIVTALQGANRHLNQRRVPRLNPGIRARLVEDYNEDILKLQELIERDLSHWLGEPNRVDEGATVPRAVGTRTTRR